jgi:hypothetical protein
VGDVQDVGAGRSQDRRQPRQGSRAVADADGDFAHPPVRREAAVDDPREHGDVDVAACQDEHDLLTLEVAGRRHRRRQRDGAGAFDHRLLQLQQLEHGARDRRLVDEQQLVQPRADQLEAELADLGDRQAVRQRGLGIDSADGARLE